MQVDANTSAGRFEIPRKVRLESWIRKQDVRRRIYSEMLRAWVTRPELGLVGSYPGDNVGDLALGAVLREVARQRGVRTAQQPHRLIRQYPPADAFIIGGGGLIPHAAKGMLELANRFPDLASRTAVAGVGVGGRLNPGDMPEKLIEFFGRVPYFSVRSQYDREQIERATGLHGIRVRPDMVFGFAVVLKVDLTSVQRATKRLGINVLPFFMTAKDGAFCPVEANPHWAREKDFPELARHRAQAGQRYVAMLRDVIAAYTSTGWEVVVIPFHTEDEAFGRTVLGDMPVKFLPYTPSPVHTLRAVAKCERLIASRFHAHVFAMLTRTPLFSFGYDVKCEALWREMELPRTAQVNRIDYIYGHDLSVDQLLEAEPAFLDESKLAQVQQNAVRGAVDALQVVYP